MTPSDNSHSEAVRSTREREFGRSLASRIAGGYFGRLARFARKATGTMSLAFVARGVMPNSIWTGERDAKTRVRDKSRQHYPAYQSIKAEASYGMLAHALIRREKKRADWAVAPGMTHDSLRDAMAPVIRGRTELTRARGPRAGAANRQYAGELAPLVEWSGSRIARASGAHAATRFTPPSTNRGREEASGFAIGPINEAVRSTMGRVRATNWPRMSFMGERLTRGAAAINGLPLAASGHWPREGARLMGGIEQIARQARRIVAPRQHYVIARASGRRILADDSRLGRVSRRPDAPSLLQPRSRRMTIASGAGQSGESKIVINYAPNVTVNGGAEIGDVDSLLMDALRRHGYELAGILGREAAVRRRAEF